MIFSQPPNNTKGRINFENKLLRLALLIGLFPTFFLIYTLYSHEMSIYVKIMLIFFVFVVVLYCAFSIRQQVVFQLRTSSNIMEAVKSGDTSVRAHNYCPSSALGQFNQILNGLSETLAEQSLVTREKQILLNTVIAQIDVAIIAINHTSHITLMNPAAEELFNCRFEAMRGWPITELGLQKVVEGEHRKVAEFEIKEYKKKVYIHTDEYFEKGIRQKLIFITDIQNILREEERLAWQRLLRVLSHEINNSLAPITSIGETFSKFLENNKTSMEIGQDLKDGLSVITERSKSLTEFIGSYQQLAQLPSPNKTLFNISQLMKSVSLLFENSNIRIQGANLIIFADKNQLQQVLVNLLKNACESMLGNPAGEITLKCEKQPDNICLHVLDEGSGIDNMENLFVPYYTTKSQGSGIGLVLSRQIIMNHGGDLTIGNRDGHAGVKATVYLPMSDYIEDSNGSHSTS